MEDSELRLTQLGGLGKNHVCDTAVLILFCRCVTYESFDDEALNERTSQLN